MFHLPFWRHEVEIPDGLHYTEDHEWFELDEDGEVGTVGITDYAQSELGDIVYVELAGVGEEVRQKEAFGTVEAVKTVAELYAPVAGEIVEVNEALTETPELINHDPYGEGWMMKIRVANKEELDILLSAEDYTALVA